MVAAQTRSGDDMLRPLLAAFALLAAAMPAFAADAVVSQKSRAFRPGEVTINRGDAVVFTNEDNFLHQIYVGGLFDTEEKSPGEDVREVFNQSGTFLVRCHIHPTMKMTVKVR